ncbi:phage tail protein [Paenibacillus koleovorans]|uniref:phage tail protein n=1 Tax=Paenibacillus koleovorans TaxID=121608 RepID=UPI000FDC2747|nr:phage tail protein [Paenibacillus koleovorans]
MLKVFDKNLVPLGILTDATEVQRRRRINSDYDLSFQVPMTSEDYVDSIRLKGHVQDERGQFYVINSRRRDRKKLKRMALVSCRHVMFKLADIKMPYDAYVGEAFGVSISTLTDAISDATSGVFTFSIDSTFDPKDIKDFGRGNALQALNFVVSTFGCEVDPDNFVIHLKERIGIDRGLQYRYGKNTMGLTFGDDVGALVTRMFAQMKDGLTFIDLPASHLTSEEQDLLNTVPGAIAGGLIKVNYLISPYAASWSNSTNTYYDGEIIDQNIEDPLELLEATRKALRRAEVPQLDIHINPADLHKIDPEEPEPYLGDDVLCVDEGMEMLDIGARIVELVEYPFAMDKHASVNLANFLKRDYNDIIADLDRSKRIVDDLMTGGRVRTTAFESAARQAITDINNSKTELIYPEDGGILAQDKLNPQRQVKLTAAGLGVSTDGWETVRAAVTADGVAAEYVVGILGEFAQVYANQIVIGPFGQTIGDGLIGSAGTWNNKTTLLTSGGIYTGQVTTDQLIAGVAKISTAMIDSLIVGTNVGLGTAKDAAGVTTIIGNTVTTGYVNALGITANYVVAGISLSAPSITGGSISAGTTINVGTDLTVGNNIYVGNQSSNTAKSIQFSSAFGWGASISYNAGELTINAADDINLNAFGVIGVNINKAFIGAGQINGDNIAGQSWVQNTAVINAKFK